MDNFTSLSDLYKRLTPALNSKVRELNNLGYIYIKEEDVWNYLSETKWSKCDNLFLCDMVDNIFNLDNELLNNYVLNKLKNEKRNIKEMDVL